MAEILVLPVRLGGFDEAMRLGEKLAAAHECGTDLGPRALHIQAAGDRLLELARALERAIVELDLSLIESGHLDPDKREALRGLVIEAKRLANMAQRFPATL
ncbi:hypothetical protein [Methylobacterium sp. D54C]